MGGFAFLKGKTVAKLNRINFAGVNISLSLFLYTSSLAANNY